MQVADDGIANVAERSNALFILVDIDGQRMAIALERASEGLAAVCPNHIRHADVGHERGVHIALTAGILHHGTEGVPVLRRTNLEVGRCNGYGRFAALHVERNLIIYARAV